MLNGYPPAAETQDAPRGVHAIKGEAPADGSRGAHVKKGDPLLSVEGRAMHAMRSDLEAPPVSGTPVLEAVPFVSTGPELHVEVQDPTDLSARGGKRARRTTTRPGVHAASNRRWRLLPVAGAAGALVVGLGGGAAFAYLHALPGHGSGSARTTAGGPVAVAITATTGKADLLPGAAGAVYLTLRNTSSSATTFDEVAPGATVVSDNTALCASSYVSIAQTLPYTIPNTVTVGPGSTSGVQSIPNLVKLAPNAPSTCQGVTFTVRLSLTGQSS